MAAATTRRRWSRASRRGRGPVDLGHEDHQRGGDLGSSTLASQIPLGTSPEMLQRCAVPVKECTCPALKHNHKYQS
ncbi:unnamed protein product [Gadus morhua 'NCC']